MKVGRNPFVLRPILSTVESIHIAGKERERENVKCKYSCSLEIKEAFPNRSGIRKLRAFLKD